MHTKNKVIFEETKDGTGEDANGKPVRIHARVTITATTNPADTRAGAYLLFLRAYDRDDRGCRETILLDDSITTDAQAIREGIKFIDQLSIPDDLVLQ